MWGLKVFSVEVTNVGFEGFLGGQWLRARLCCRKISDSIFWLFYFTPRWLAGGMPCPKKVHKKYTKKKKKKKIETDKRRKHFFHTFLYLLGEWTNQRYVPKHSVVSKTPDSKIGVVGSTSLPEKREVGSQKTWVFISLHRLQIRHSKILLILARPLPIGYVTRRDLALIWKNKKKEKKKRKKKTEVNTSSSQLKMKS